jgi:hypothetical protein
MAARTTVAMTMRSRLKSSGETSCSASLTSTKVEPQMAEIRMSSNEAMRVCFAMGVLLVLSRDYVGEVCRMAGDHCAQHLGAEDAVRRDRREIAIEYDEVGHQAGCKRSFVGLAELCVG